MVQTLRRAWRALTLAPWYSLTVVLVLAGGIALTTVTFAIADGVLFKPLAYRNPDQLYLIRADTTTAPQDAPSGVTWDEVRIWREAVPEHLIGVSRATARREQQVAVREFYVAEVDEHLLAVLGVTPLFGGFQVGDHEPVGPSPLTVRPRLVSHALWRSLYGSSESVIGQVTIRSDIQGRQFADRIDGVLPEGFVFPVAYGQPQPDVLVPTGSRTTRGRPSADTRHLQAIIRIEDPRDVLRVRARLLAATLDWARNGASTLRVPGGTAVLAAPFDEITLVPLTEHIGALERPALLLVMSAAGAVLLLACLNASGLATARAIGRGRDLAVHRALGATSWHLVRDQLAESVWLVPVAGGLALLASGPLLAWTVLVLPATLATFESPSISARVFVAAAVAGASSLLVVSLWPALVVIGANLLASLNKSSSTMSGSARGHRMLIGVQSAAGFVLLTAGGLTATSLVKVWTEDPGYDTRDLVVVEAAVRRYARPDEVIQRLISAREAIRRASGATEVAASTAQPLLEQNSIVPSTNWVPERITDDNAMVSGVSARAVTSNYFAVLGLDLVEGSWPDPATWDADGPVAIVSEAAARLWWPERTAVGQILARLPFRTRSANSVRVVVGVVRDARYSALDRGPMPNVYVPGPFHAGFAQPQFFFRTPDPAEAVLPRVTRALALAELAVYQAHTVSAGLFRTVRHRALPAWLFGLIGGAGLVLLGVSIAGLLAMSVERRRREVGIRVALGSTQSGIVALLAKEQLRPVVAGLAVGSVVAVWSVRSLESQLYGVSPYNPSVWTVAILAVLTTAAVGALIPALRSVRASPVASLREQ